jgi:hypothetical protein
MALCPLKGNGRTSPKKSGSVRKHFIGKLRNGGGHKLHCPSGSSAGLVQRVVFQFGNVKAKYQPPKALIFSTSFYHKMSSEAASILALLRPSPPKQPAIDEQN